MADKVLGIILPSDNTKVNIGTAELPKWKAPFVPDYFRGEQEFFSFIDDFDKAAKWLSENSFEKGGKIK